MKTGDIVKANGNTGVVLSVYVSPDTGGEAIEIMFVRNVMKIQPPELHLKSTFFSIETATKEEMEAEFQSFLELQKERFDGLLKGSEAKE